MLAGALSLALAQAFVNHEAIAIGLLIVGVSCWAVAVVIGFSVFARDLFPDKAQSTQKILLGFALVAFLCVWVAYRSLNDQSPHHHATHTLEFIDGLIVMWFPGLVYLLVTLIFTQVDAEARDEAKRLRIEISELRHDLSRIAEHESHVPVDPIKQGRDAETREDSRSRCNSRWCRHH